MGEDRFEERIYKSIWHVALFGVGLFEYSHLKTKLGKALAIGMMAFHIDAAYADASDRKSLSRVLLERVTGK